MWVHDNEAVFLHDRTSSFLSIRSTSFNNFLGQKFCLSVGGSGLNVAGIIEISKPEKTNNLEQKNLLFFNCTIGLQIINVFLDFWGYFILKFIAMLSLNEWTNRAPKLPQSTVQNVHRLHFPYTNILIQMRLYATKKWIFTWGISHFQGRERKFSHDLPKVKLNTIWSKIYWFKYFNVCQLRDEERYLLKKCYLRFLVSSMLSLLSCPYQLQYW